MASLSHSKNLYTIYVTRGDKRYPIRLGKCGKRAADAVREHVEALEVARRTNTQLPARTSGWLEDIDAKMRARLHKAGLMTLQPKEPMPLGAYFTNYIERRTDLKPGTRRVLRDVWAASVVHFGADRDMRAVTVGDVEDYQRALLTSYARATAAMHIKKMRQLWNDAIKRKLLMDNPFKAVKAGSMANRSREFYVPAEWINKVIEYVPDIEWKLIFALARFGGLRVPSEIRALRWDDIHWFTGRITVHSPKTEHHEGKESRDIPLFPELSKMLSDHFVCSDTGVTHIISRLRGANLATTARKWIERAGLKPWPRLWTNLRSSRETDLAGKFPIHVVCAWIGNSVSVAMRHYLQVTDEHFAAGAQSGKGSHDVSRTNSEHQQGEPSDLPDCAQSERSLQDANRRSNLPLNLGRIEQKASRIVRKQMRGIRSYARRIDRLLLAKLETETMLAWQRAGGAR